MTWEELLSSPFKIFTVTTHNSSLLTETKRMFNMDDDAFHKMMRAAHLKLTIDLEHHGIDYNSLAKALLPQHDRKEIALLFDWKVSSARSNGFYGHDIAEAWIPALPKPKGTVPVNSILRGDLLNATQVQLMRAMRESAIFHDPDILIDPRTVYCVYITNLAKTQADTLIAAAEQHPAYLGYANCTNRNRLKGYLGGTLVNAGMRVGDLILDGVHYVFGEFDGVPNALGLPYAENGFTPTAIREDLFLPFLSYRINSHLTGRNREDEYATLTTLHPDAFLVESPSIWMTPDRYGYLHKDHRPSLEYAGLAHLEQPALEQELSKLAERGHLYNLRYNEHGALMYSALVDVETEGGVCKTFTLSLKFHPVDKRVELVTFF